MNLQVSPAQLVETPVPPADDAGAALARALDAAKLSSEQALLDALAQRRVTMGMSLASLDIAANLAAGHASKLIGPSRVKTPTTRSLFALLDALSLSIVLVNDPSKANGAAWTPRAEEKVRTNGAISQAALHRARPHVVAELARKAGHPKWRTMPAAEFMAMMEKSR